LDAKSSHWLRQVHRSIGAGRVVVAERIHPQLAINAVSPTPDQSLRAVSIRNLISHAWLECH
jgi:hypothetical protein